MFPLSYPTDSHNPQWIHLLCPVMVLSRGTLTPRDCQELTNLYCTTHLYFYHATCTIVLQKSPISLCVIGNQVKITRCDNIKSNILQTNQVKHSPTTIAIAKFVVWEKPGPYSRELKLRITLELEHHSLFIRTRA